jgi:hypothetical protein
MALTEDLLARILAFCAAHGMTERQFGLAVTNNHKLISRLRSGFGVNSQTHDRIVSFIENRERDAAATTKRARRTPALATPPPLTESVA